MLESNGMENASTLVDKSGNVVGTSYRASEARGIK